MITTYENHNIGADVDYIIDALGPEAIANLNIDDVEYVGYESIRVALDFNMCAALKARITLEHNDTFTVTVAPRNVWLRSGKTYTDVHVGELEEALTRLVLITPTSEEVAA